MGDFVENKVRAGCIVYKKNWYRTRDIDSKLIYDDEPNVTFTIASDSLDTELLEVLENPHKYSEEEVAIASSIDESIFFYCPDSILDNFVSDEELSNYIKSNL